MYYIPSSAKSLDLWSQNFPELEPGQLCIEISRGGSWGPVELAVLEEALLSPL